MSIVRKVGAYSVLVLLGVTAWVLAQGAGKNLGTPAVAQIPRAATAPEDVARDLRVLADRANEQLPMMIDGGRMDRVDVKGATLHYHFTMPISDADTIAPDALTFARVIAARNTCHGLGHILARNATVTYHYYSGRGSKLAEFSITTADCR